LKPVYLSKENWRKIINFRKQIGAKTNNVAMTELLAILNHKNSKKTDNNEVEQIIKDDTMKRLLDIQEKNMLNSVDETINKIISILEEVYA